MKIRLLGPLQVTVGERDVDVSGARLRTLLIRLAIDAPHAVSSSALVAAVWGDEPPADEANALQSLVSRLRRALGGARHVASVGTGYQLAINREDVDIFTFAEGARAGREQLRALDYNDARATLRSALALWRGPSAQTWGDSVDATAFQARLDDQRLEVIADRIAADIALGNAADVIGELEQLLAQAPLRERFTALVMRALALTGRQSEALDRFEALRARLADDLGIDPSAELREAHLAVVRGEFEAPATRATPAARRSNLKAAFTSFVGRDEELARIAKLLDEFRLVSLVGPGGAGKTRLAGVAGSTLLDTLPDGVWFAELASVTDPVDVAVTVLDALDLRDATLLDRTSATTPSARNATARLIDALMGRPALLILDNCEHVIEAAARLVDELLAQCPQLRILATSREALGIVGEALVLVPPLSMPDPGAELAVALENPAVLLFADRATAVDPTFNVDDANVRHVVEIVRRLDGLPLAIELAAARLRSLSVSEIATRLSDRFKLLTGGSRTAMPRHRTLRAVVEWSWDLLDDAERLLADRLCVFSGTMNATDVATVCADDALPTADIDDLLALLVEKSLLQVTFVDGESRYRMLETLREFGVERLIEQSAITPARLRHAMAYAALVREAVPITRTAAQLPWMRRLESERDNIFTALRFWCDHGPAADAIEMATSLATYWMLTGRDSECRYWLSLALQTAGTRDDNSALIAEALLALSSVASTVSGDPREVDAMLVSTRELSKRLDGIEPPVDPMLSLLRPVVALFADDAPDRIERLVVDGLRCPDPWIAASVRMYHAAVAENNGDVDTMRRDSELALSQFRALGERWGLASSLGLLAEIKMMDGDLAGAIADTEEAFALSSELAGHDDSFMLTLRLADLLGRVGDIEGAREKILSLERLAELTSSSVHKVFMQVALADLARRDGNLAAASQLQAEALARLAQMPPTHPIQGHLAAMVLCYAARLSVAQNDLAAARDQLEQACEYAVGTKDMPIVAQVAVSAAILCRAQDRAVAGAELLGAAAKLRGAEDATQLDIAALTTALKSILGSEKFASTYSGGRALAPAAAIELLQSHARRR